MPNYRYTARNAAGAEESGVLKASSTAHAVATLRQNGLMVVRVEEDRGSFPFRLPSLNPWDYRGIGPADVELAFQQLAVLLRSGVALLDAVQIVAEFSRPAVRKVWDGIARRVRAGGDFAGALAEHKAFGTLVVQLVTVGEQSGRLDHTLRQACLEMEEARKIRAQIVSALLYPCFALLFAIGVAIFMLVKIIPEIKKMLSIMGRKMPPITQALIDSSNWIETHAPGLAVGALVLSVTFLLLYQLPPVRLAVDAHALRLPLLGRVFRLSGTVEFARTLGLLLRSGVRMVDALAMVERIHYNRHLARGVAIARHRVTAGSSLAEPLMHRYGYLPLLPRMIAVGESSGTLDHMLEEMAVFHDELLKKAIARLIGLIGPLVTMLVGGMIAFVYAAFLVAMFTAAGGAPR